MMPQIKQFLFIIPLLCIFSMLHAQQNPLPISERVGMEIDADEREYFNLFQGIEGFKSAIYRYDGFGNLQFLISLENGNDTVLVVGSAGVPELINYIERHESIFEQDGYEVNWSLLYGIRPKKLLSYEHKGDVFTVFTKDVMYVGELLHVTDSSLMLWQKDGYYNYEEHKTKVIHLMASDISMIVRKKNLKLSKVGLTLGTGLAAGFLAMTVNFMNYQKDASAYSLLWIPLGAAALGVGAGILIDYFTDKTRRINVAGNPDVYRKYIKKLKKRAIFRTLIPPELRTFKPLKG